MSIDLSLKYFAKLYKTLKDNALCVDIETAFFDGPISVIGIYKPQDGLVDLYFTSYVKGKNLTFETLKEAFQNCKLVITFNGLTHDIPKIRQEFPGVIPDYIPIIDLYLWTRKLYANTNLKVIEQTLGITRLHEESSKRGQAIRLWKRYQTYKDEHALLQLLEYNKQDTINLYPLAEEIIRKIEQKIT